MKLLLYITSLLYIVSCSPYDGLDKKNPSYEKMSDLEKIEYNSKFYGFQIKTNTVILNEGHLYERHEEHWLVLYSPNSPILENMQEIRKHSIEDMEAGVENLNTYSKKKYINNANKYYLYQVKTNNWRTDVDYVEAENGDFLLLRKIKS